MFLFFYYLLINLLKFVRNKHNHKLKTIFAKHIHYCNPIVKCEMMRTIRPTASELLITHLKVQTVNENSFGASCFYRPPPSPGSAASVDTDRCGGIGYLR